MQGYALVALAILLLWLAQHFDMTPQQAHHKFLVSTSQARGDVFEKSVILVLHHLKSGATGIVLNKHGKGGPVGAEKVFTLHSLEAKSPETVVLKDINLGLVEGRAEAEKLLKQKPAPKWHMTVTGYAGWGGRQLDYELDRGEWRVVAFDTAILRADAAKMWDAADRTAKQK